MPEPISYYSLVKIAKRFHETRPKSNVQIHSQINDIILRRKCNMLAILFFIMANSIINIARRIFYSEVVLLKEKYFVQIIGNFIAITNQTCRKLLNHWHENETERINVEICLFFLSSSDNILVKVNTILGLKIMLVSKKFGLFEFSM